MVFRQMRIEKRIAREEEIAPFAVEDRGIVIVLERGSADRLAVNERGMRGIDVDQPAPPGPQGEIDVVVDDRLRFVEAAERIEGLAPGQQARPGNGDDVALGQGEAEISRI